MEQYIDKSAVTAEIERKIKDYNTPIDRLGSNNIRLNECKDILSFLNTLEVKEINSTDTFIEKACEMFCKIRCNGKPPRSTCTSLGTCCEHDNFRKSLKEE